MNVYDGNKLDTTDIESDQYLRVNSCGIQNVALDYTVTVRDRGRRDYHLLILKSGSCLVYYGENEYKLSAGDFVIYPPHEKQKYIFSPFAVSLWCHFTGTAANEILSSAGLPSGVHRANLTHELTDIFLTLMRRVNEQSCETLVNSTLLELLYLLSHPKNTSADIPPCISRVLDLIHESYDRNLTLDTLASISGYSASRFSHIFSKTLGTTPIKYINSLRLENACRLLTSTTLPIGEISSACGYNDQLYFCKLFTKRYGAPPTEYRKRHE